MQDVLEVLVELVDLKAIGRMERQRDHGLDARQVDLDATVIVGDIGGLELAVVVAAAMHGQKRVRILVGGQMLDRQVVSVVMTSTPLR